MNLSYILKRIAYSAGKIHAKLISLKPNIKTGSGTIIESGVVLRCQAGG